ncbi:MAG: hypothetical protein HY606_12720 [Planctomycetes bacterium]|nr:hypothetical protein [Planctomycetota bacterium]
MKKYVLSWFILSAVVCFGYTNSNWDGEPLEEESEWTSVDTSNASRVISALPGSGSDFQAAALTNGRFMCIYSSSGDIYAKVLFPDSSLSEELVVTNNPGNQKNMSVTLNDAMNTCVVWEDEQASKIFISVLTSAPALASSFTTAGLQIPLGSNPVKSPQIRYVHEIEGYVLIYNEIVSASEEHIKLAKIYLSGSFIQRLDKFTLSSSSSKKRRLSAYSSSGPNEQSDITQIVVACWEEKGVEEKYTVYAQAMDVIEDGFVSGWQQNGNKVFGTKSDEMSNTIAVINGSDFVVITQYRNPGNNSDILVNKTDITNGTPRWGQNGEGIEYDVLSRDQTNPDVCLTYNGDFFVVLEDRIDPQNFDILGGILSKSSGALLMSSLICTDSSKQSAPKVITTVWGKRSMIVWEDERNSGTSGTDLYAQTVDCLTGQELWSKDGVPICTKSGAQSGHLIKEDISSAGYQGDVVAFFLNAANGNSFEAAMITNKDGLTSRPNTPESFDRKITIGKSLPEAALFLSWVNTSSIATDFIIERSMTSVPYNSSFSRFLSAGTNDSVSIRVKDLSLGSNSFIVRAETTYVSTKIPEGEEIRTTLSPVSPYKYITVIATPLDVTAIESNNAVQLTIKWEQKSGPLPSGNSEIKVARSFNGGEYSELSKTVKFSSGTKDQNNIYTFKFTDASINNNTVYSYAVRIYGNATYTSDYCAPVAILTSDFDQGSDGGNDGGSDAGEDDGDNDGDGSTPIFIHDNTAPFSSPESEAGNHKKRKSSGLCYIATGTFQNRNCSAIESLIYFRSIVLSNNAIGLSSLRIYSKLSPSLAANIPCFSTKKHYSLILGILSIAILIAVVRIRSKKKLS